MIAQTAFEASRGSPGAHLVRVPARVIVDVHADWRTSTRLYGSPHRRLLGPLGDRVSAFALRRADAVRTISGYTTGLVRDAGVEPAGVFPAYMDLDPFLERPPEELPERPVALFVGVLEAYKNVDGPGGCLAACRPRSAGCAARIVGKGTRTDVIERLVAELPGQVSWDRELPTPAVAAALDDASFLVLPSRSEGLGRVVIEALCRAASGPRLAVGGIPDLIEDGRNGLLVEPGTPRLSPTRYSACSPTARCWSDSPPRRGQASRHGSRRLRNTRPGCGCSSSTREAHSSSSRSRLTRAIPPSPRRCR